jgi:hypothetical protein
MSTAYRYRAFTLPNRGFDQHRGHASRKPFDDGIEAGSWTPCAPSAVPPRSTFPIIFTEHTGRLNARQVRAPRRATTNSLFVAAVQTTRIISRTSAAPATERPSARSRKPAAAATGLSARLPRG